MASTSTTLSDFLRKSNPRISNVRCSPGNNTTSKKSTWEQPRYIEQWEDFDCKAMQRIYDGILQELLADQYDFENIEHPRRRIDRMISDERSLEGAVLLHWNYKIVKEALRQSQSRLFGRPDRKEVFLVIGSQALLSGFNGDLKPDWAGIQGEPADSQDESIPLNILPGETKLSKKWSSINIKMGEVKTTYQKTDWLRPIAQLFTYCVQSGSRYGYIITDKELLAARIRPTSHDDRDDSALGLESKQSITCVRESPTERARRSGIMECRVIPWHFPETNDPNQLTVNQAIWYLHMLAAENSKIEDNYRPLKEESCRHSDTVAKTVLSPIRTTRKRRHDEVTTSSTSEDTRNFRRKRRTPMSRQSTQTLSFTST